MSERCFADSCSQITYKRYAAYFHSHMVGCSSFNCCRHTYNISSKSSCHSDFCRRFESRSCELAVNSFFKIYVIFLCSLSDYILELRIINVTHVRKTCTKLIYIFSYQRIRHKNAYLVSYHHEITGFEFRINTSACIGKKQYLSSHKLHKSCREYNICYRISFIVVNSSFHTYNRNTTHISEYKFSGMSRNS